MPSEEQVLQALWDEYELRQTHYWSSFNRFALAILTVSVIPYVKPDLASMLGKLVAVFPVVSLLISLASSWLLGAEYQRLRMVRQKYDELLGSKYQIPRMPRDTVWERLVALRIGTATSVMFGIGFVLLSLINLIVLLAIPLGGDP